MVKSGNISPTIHVVLDSNALFTDYADRLLSAEVSKFILSEVEPLGLTIHWYLPALVKGERNRQMAERGLKLLKGIKDLEALLGHNLGINEEVVRERVASAISKQIVLHGLTEVDLDCAAVNWQAVISSAVDKVAPFSPGNEKGFKDAILLETFCGILKGLPKSRQAARAVLLTEDALLREATELRTRDRENVVVLADVAALRSMLNALATHLEDDVVADITKKATQLFHEKGRPSSLVEKWELVNKITDKFLDTIAVEPAPGFSRPEATRVVIKPASFVQKKGAMITFSTIIEIEVSAKKVILGSGPNRLAELTALGENLSKSKQGNLEGPSALQRLASDNSSRRVVSQKGTHRFRVQWEATLSTQGRLIRPKFLELSYLDVDWDDEVAELT